MTASIRPIHGGPFGGLLSLHFTLDEPDATPNPEAAAGMLVQARAYAHVGIAILDLRGCSSYGNGLALEEFRAILQDFSLRVGAIWRGDAKPIWADKLTYKIIEPAGPRWMSLSCNELRVPLAMARDPEFLTSIPTHRWNAPGLDPIKTPPELLIIPAQKTTAKAVLELNVETSHTWRLLPPENKTEMTLT